MATLSYRVQRRRKVIKVVSGERVGVGGASKGNEIQMSLIKEHRTFRDFQC